MKRSALIEPPDHLIDPGRYNKNVVHFRHWNAHSIFFYDPAGNVVEYIARHTLPNPLEGAFTTSDILYISEIGVVVNDIAAVHPVISNRFGLEKYSTSSEQFMALGDEQGLVLLMGKGTKAAFRKGRDRGIYGTEVFLSCNGVISRLDIEEYPYTMYGR